MEIALSDRLQKLESSLAHIEHLYEELNKVVTEQSRVLSRLQAQNRQMSEAVETIELERIRATNPKPPHYQ
ncbi:MAG: SlyX family protein [Pedosphaera sp.]|nr:SlyX family protein [Pedosphaera sp.]